MQKDIGEIIKTQTVKTVLRFTEFKGRNFLDIRDFFKAKNATQFGPTKKGICLDISKISDLINLLERAEADLKAEEKQ
jgi:hypothetical protein